MTIKRCMKCGKVFSTKHIKLKYFCSIDCKNDFTIKQNYENEEYTKWLKIQAEMDFKAKQKAKKDDYRLSKYS